MSFLLGYIHALGDRYLPAIQGLRQRRDTLSNTVFSGAGTEREILLFAALNRELGEDRKTLEAYEHLRERAARVGESVSTLLPYVVDLLLERRRYAEVLQDAGDVNAMIDHLIRRAELHSEMFAASDSTPAWYGATALRLRQSAVDEGGGYYEALLGVRRYEEAARVSDALLRLSTTGDSFASLIERALHADATAPARALVERAQEVLPEAQQAAIRALLERIPSPG